MQSQLRRDFDLHSKPGDVLASGPETHSRANNASANELGLLEEVRITAFGALFEGYVSREASPTASDMSSNVTMFPGVALVTGAASGIGRQCALAFVAEGCSRIALIDRDEDGMSETSRLCKETARLTRPKSTVSTFIIPCDVSLEAEVAVALDYVVEEWGRIDYAVNCAGVGGTAGPSHRQAVDEFDRVTGTNCRGTWLSARGEIIRMLDQEPLKTHDGRRGNRGVIVNVASNMGLVSRPECPAYAASKAAIVSLTKSDAIDYAKENIRINCVCPGIIKTPMTADIRDGDPQVQRAPMRRMGTAQEVADVVMFLCSSKATFVHGATICVDGGYTAC
ncbi:hypothetical protein MCOR27_001106 [Pyricularia oryzae]|uniref:Ketoreductase domain-containing protein n=2 Tax=Pyricularia TaxID=48558 RepID=A0ABQ8P0D6_PYRGI|nr:hypothetical protein MCOR01_003161 [Pyricularia oryzae]KAI6303470.1 hypothetical protein MCOR33_001358 [Pyricularia grisea]KAI6276894.1 hypothetical protein MCOR26_005384 [Pyricularia oryzae]KAI6288085.1 hypothetical protein MCOR27_001106 [Pyricularia oryzae]KAI6323325.1 hypothetical protein MCOR29_004458 [Pyricularia oryzae]